MCCSFEALLQLVNLHMQRVALLFFLRVEPRSVPAACSSWICRGDGRLDARAFRFEVGAINLEAYHLALRLVLGSLAKSTGGWPLLVS